MKHFGFARQQAPQTFVTESYVSVPPAAWIIDETSAVWELGNQRAPEMSAGFHQRYAADPGGEFAFVVLRNGQSTGEFASRIERRNGRIRIFLRDGWKIWNGRSFF